MKTNAARQLESLGIAFTLNTFEVKEEHVSADEIADSLGIEEDKLFKTLVLKGTKDPYLVAVIPSNAHLNLKKLAQVSGNKHCEMLPMKDLLNVTGYIRGGCSPVGMKKLFPTFIDEWAELQEQIYISGGKRGVQIVLAPQDLIAVTHAQLADISDPA